MRISDWSSDVCSSDLPRATIIGTLATGLLYLIVCSAIALMLPAAEVATSEAPFSLFVATYWGHGPAVWIAAFRSEEHTSDLKSLMRISYAVFCLRKK